MTGSRFSPKFIAGIIVALFFGVALYLRIALPYDKVFGGRWIKFTSADAYYHMRLVDNLVHNFPHRITFDPYIFFPYGSTWPSMPFFDWLLAGITLLVGLGSPTQHTVDVVGAYFPAILGALTVIPVYFIGKALFNRWVGVISAGLIAILPGEFLGRSSLGFTDHHVAETLFSTIAILFLIMAIKSAKQRQLTFNHLTRLNLVAVRRPLIYSLLAGIFLGIYLVTWTGALLFVFVIFIYFIVQFISDHMRGESTDYLCLVGVIPSLVALIMFLFVSQQMLYLAPLIIVSLTPLVMNGISRLMTAKGIKRVYYPVTLVVLGLAGVGIIQAVDPFLLKSMLSKFHIFAPGVFLQTVQESQSLLFPTGSFSLSLAWASFTTSFFLSLISLVVLIYLFIKRGTADKTLFLVWSLVMLAAVLGERRFGYYFTVNVALLSGYLSTIILMAIVYIITYLRGEPTKYLSWQMVESADVQRLAVESMSTTLKKVRRKKARGDKRQRSSFHITSWISAFIIVLLLSFVPNINPAIKTTSVAPFAPSDAWCSSLDWLRENSPEPFGDPDYYYGIYESPQRRKDYNYPDSAYGVTAWWDYGHWITRIARRLPNHGPGGGWSANVARCFITQDETSSYKIMDKLKSKYLVVDYYTTTDKFYAVAFWGGGSKDNFFEVYYVPQDGELVAVQLFYIEYYRSLAVRLYNFDSNPVTPENSMVISYEEKVDRDGKAYKEIIGGQSFTSYEEAEAYISSQESGNHRIVGLHPFISPVPLEPLGKYRLIHSSDSSIMVPEIGEISEVKVFEYVGD